MRVDFYAIEGGVYLVPTIEVVWDEVSFGVSLIWFNRDMTIWLKQEKDEDKKYSIRKSADPFFDHYENHPASADYKYKKEPERCGSCLEPMYNPDGLLGYPLTCRNPRCITNLGYSEYDTRR